MRSAVMLLLAIVCLFGLACGSSPIRDNSLYGSLQGERGQTLLFAPASPGFLQRQSLLIKNNGVSLVSLLGAWITDDKDGVYSIALRPPLPHVLRYNDGNQALFAIEFRPIREEVAEATLRLYAPDDIRSDSSGFVDIKLASRARDKSNPPCMEGIDFGAVPVGQAVKKSCLFYSNIGNISLTEAKYKPQSKEPTSPFMWELAMPQSLRYGKDFLITVGFKPPTKGSFEGAFVLTTSTPLPTPLAIQVKGSGE